MFSKVSWGNVRRWFEYVIDFLESIYFRVATSCTGCIDSELIVSVVSVRNAK